MRQPPVFPILAAVLAAAVLTILYFNVRMVGPADPSARTGAETEATALERPTVEFINPSIGPADAPVTIVEFGDYLCAPCAALNLTLKRLAAEYPEDVRLVWKDMPAEGQRPGAARAAMAARCAADQGRFWEFQSALFSIQAGLDTDGYLRQAQALGLDNDRFRNCLENRQTEPLVTKDLNEGIRLRIDATPYIFVNGRRLSGAVEYSLLRGIIESEINIALRNAAPAN